MFERGNPGMVRWVRTELTILLNDGFRNENTATQMNG